MKRLTAFGADDDADDGVDRISELPESILHNILTLHPFKTVTKLSSLSKTWKQVSVSYPNLMFDIDNFFAIYYYGGVREPLKKLQQQFHIIERILTTFRESKLTINIFQLDLWLTRHLDWSSRIDKWIQDALHSNVRELRLSFSCRGGTEMPLLRRELRGTGFSYNLPHFVLLAKSIVTLVLHHCKLPPVDSVFKTNLSSIKKLCLHHVDLNDYDSPHLFANVEDLTLKKCSGLTSLRISHAAKLKKVMLSCNSDLESVYIDALSLIEADFGDGSTIKVIDIKHCKNLISITVYVNIAVGWLNEGLNYYPALQYLFILICYKKTMKGATISSNSLKTLEIINFSRRNKLEVNAPNLSQFTYSGYAPEFSLNAPALASASLAIYHFSKYIGQAWHVRHIEFLSKFKHCHKVDLNYHKEQISIVPQKVRETMASPLSSVEELEIFIVIDANRPKKKRIADGASKIEPSKELIDSLSWIYPRSRILGRVVLESGEIFTTPKYIFKFFRGKRLDKKKFFSSADHPVTRSELLTFVAHTSTAHASTMYSTNSASFDSFATLKPTNFTILDSYNSDFFVTFNTASLSFTFHPAEYNYNRQQKDRKHHHHQYMLFHC
ncbi:hypothetical protein ACFE04_012300 [Oxalis oulophora]